MIDLQAALAPTLAPTALTGSDGALIISEYFGPTVQGEGPSLGRPAVFLRLGGCNLACSWCDTPYTWDWTGKIGPAYDPRKELRRASFEELDGWLQHIHTTSRVRLLVVTGGEPTLQSAVLNRFLTYIADSSWFWEWQVEIETNGTRVPKATSLITRYNVSPKLSNSHNPRHARLQTAALQWYVLAPSCFKFVVTDPADFVEIDALVQQYTIPASRVYIMPEGRSQAILDERSLALIEGVIARGFNITPRLHVQLWGDKRGK